MKRSPFIALLLLALTAAFGARAEENGNLESLKRAATAGDVAAQYEVGVLYEFGFNMDNNLVPALAWYMVAADNGDDRAAKRRDLLSAQLNPAQVDEARKLKAELLAAAPAEARPQPPALAAPEVAPAPAAEGGAQAPAAAPEAK
jgi:TPR repeat protein